MTLATRICAISASESRFQPAVAALCATASARASLCRQKAEKLSKGSAAAAPAARTRDRARPPATDRNRVGWRAMPSGPRPDRAQQGDGHVVLDDRRGDIDVAFLGQPRQVVF